MTDQTTLQVGDIVKLRSGGPEMTVQSIPNGNTQIYYRCQWFAGKKLEFGNFPAGSLEQVNKD